MRWFGVTVGLVLGIGVGACLDDPHKACHQRAMTALGCCPFCEEGCQVSREEIEEACADELRSLAESDDGGPASESDDSTPREPELPRPH